MRESEVAELKACCKYYLHGHRPIGPKQYFSEMSDAISSSEIADVYGEGKALQDFENKLCQLFGFQSAIFFQSGTMAQLIAMRIWAERAGSQLNSSQLNSSKRIGYHATSHLEIHEQQSYKELHGLESVLIGEKNRLINLNDLKAIQSFPSVVLVELPQREIGGQLPSWTELTEQVQYIRSQGAKLHMDGARVWECTSFYQKSLKEIASLFDSVYVSFYKGIGAIAGAALLGPTDFIDKAKVWNRRHGGNLVTAFPLYLSARENLDKRINRFESYYQKTLEIYQALCDHPKIEFVPAPPQVNLFHIYVQGRAEVIKEKALELARSKSIWGFRHIRESEKPGFAVIEWYVGDGALEIPLKEIVHYIQNLIE